MHSTLASAVWHTYSRYVRGTNSSYLQWKQRLRRSRTICLAMNGPQIFCISSVVRYTIFCLCILFTWTVCFFLFFFALFGSLRAFSLRRALRQQRKKGSFVLRAFMWWWKKAPLLFVCPTRESTKWTHWKVIKIHRFTEQFIIPSLSSTSPWLRGHGGMR